MLANRLVKWYNEKKKGPADAKCGSDARADLGGGPGGVFRPRHRRRARRSDRQAARCNKNLIYIYFTDKETLFTTVLTKHLMRIHEEQPFTPDDLPGYAAKVFDWAMANPDLMRLVAWSALEKAKGPDKRGATLDAKLAALTEAQDACRVEAAFPLISSLSPS